jgi:D-alanyl-D-alanine carboxypeptidase (penicillin-binding protein 5/6)
MGNCPCFDRWLAATCVLETTTGNMRSLISAITAPVCRAVVCWAAAVGLSALTSLHAQAQSAPEPPEVAARAYLLLDVTANQILASRELDMPVEPASLTKLMSAYLVFDALKSKKIDIKQSLGVSERASKMPGSRMFIDPKMKVPVEDLIKGMVVQSGNDATVALAEGVGGTVERFVQMMNDQAKVLGMKNTLYKNPEGQTESGQTTTARDLGTLAMRLMRDFPEYMGTYAIKKYRYPGTPTANDSNRNLLIFKDPTVDGLKTGHTDAAGYCLVATAKREFPNLGPRRLMAVVLGANSEIARANEAQKLLNWGYTAFEAVKLYEPGQAVATPAIWKGKAATVKLGRSDALVVAVPTGTASQIKTQLARPEPLVAPVTRGQAIGSLQIYRGEQLWVDMPLQALDTVEQAGVLGRAWDAMRLWIK